MFEDSDIFYLKVTVRSATGLNELNIVSNLPALPMSHDSSVQCMNAPFPHSRIQGCSPPTSSKLRNSQPLANPWPPCIGSLCESGARHDGESSITGDICHWCTIDTVKTNIVTDGKGGSTDKIVREAAKCSLAMSQGKKGSAADSGDPPDGSTWHGWGKWDPGPLGS
ncbi:hypothetical protein ACMYSQ_011224 [Aspergillus niger]